MKYRLVRNKIFIVWHCVFSFSCWRRWSFKKHYKNLKFDIQNQFRSNNSYKEIFQPPPPIIILRVISHSETLSRHNLSYIISISEYISAYTPAGYMSVHLQTKRKNKLYELTFKKNHLNIKNSFFTITILSKYYVYVHCNLYFSRC